MKWNHGSAPERVCLRGAVISLFLLAVLMLTSCAVPPIPPEGAAAEKTAAAEETVVPDEAVLSEDAAWGAYHALLAGDGSLFFEETLPRCLTEPASSAGKLEYALLDLDGDGVSELLVQQTEAPWIYNAVFHFDGERLQCWNNDQAELTCWDEPLRDGTMVQQYDYAGGCSYQFFRYLPDGSRENTGTLFRRDYFFNGGSLDPCAGYAVDGVEVEEEAFQAALAERRQPLERSAWTPLEDAPRMG